MQAFAVLSESHQARKNHKGKRTLPGQLKAEVTDPTVGGGRLLFTGSTHSRTRRGCQSRHRRPLTVTILQGIKKLAPNISGWWAVAFNVLLSFGITLVAALTSTPPPSINSLPLLIGSALASAMSASGLHSLARPNAPPLVGTAQANDTGLSPAYLHRASSRKRPPAPFHPRESRPARKWMSQSGT